MSAEEPNVSDDSDNEANRWAKPVIVLTPILSERINSQTAWLKKSRVEPRQLAVVATGEPVGDLAIEVNELADTVRTCVQVPRDPLDLERNTMMGAHLKNN